MPQGSFAEFWPVYVQAHSDAKTRLMHFLGTLAGWAILAAGIVKREWWWLPLALVVPYALAWISHFFIEHNKPATFEHPLWSWWADQRMVAMMLAGRMNEEVKKVASGNKAVAIGEWRVREAKKQQSNEVKMLRKNRNGNNDLPQRGAEENRRNGGLAQ